MSTAGAEPAGERCAGCGGAAVHFQEKGTARGVCADCYGHLSAEERRAFIERKWARFGRRG